MYLIIMECWRVHQLKHSDERIKTKSYFRKNKDKNMRISDKNNHVNLNYISYIFQTDINQNKFKYLKGPPVILEGIVQNLSTCSSFPLPFPE